MPRDNLEGRDGLGGGGRREREGTHGCLWLIHPDVWQKPTQLRKAMILQLNILKVFFKRILLSQVAKTYSK